MPKPNPKLKIYFLAISAFAFFALASQAEAAIFVDNAATGCANGATTYNPVNRTCSGGNNTVYTSLNNANSGIGSPANEAGRITINVRASNPATLNPYKEKLTITKNYTTWQKYPSDTSKPIIDGEWVRPALWGGLIHANGRTGLIIDGFYCTRAAHVDVEDKDGDGNRTETFYGGSRGIQLYNSSNCIIQNCEVVDIGDVGILLTESGSSNIIQDNYISRTNISLLHGQDWASGVMLQHVSGTIVRRNTFYGCYGESINTYHSSHDSTIEYNTIVNCPRVAILLSCSYNDIVRYNLIYHTGESGYSGGNHGIWISPERADSINKNYGHRIYGNLVAGVADSLSFTWHPNCVACQIDDVRIYNNTFVEPYKSDGTQKSLWVANANGSDVIGTGVEIKNNIFWQTNGTISDVTTGITFANNLWSKIPEADARSASDPTASAGYPTLNIAEYFQKQSGWTSLTPNSLTGAEFALHPTAVQAINKGANLGSPYNQLLNLNTSNFKTNTFNLIDQNSQGAWEVGAGVYGGGDTTAPGSPSGLMVR